MKLKFYVKRTKFAEIFILSTIMANLGSDPVFRAESRKCVPSLYNASKQATATLVKEFCDGPDSDSKRAISIVRR